MKITSYNHHLRLLLSPASWSLNQKTNSGFSWSLRSYPISSSGVKNLRMWFVVFVCANFVPFLYRRPGKAAFLAFLELRRLNKLRRINEVYGLTPAATSYLYCCHPLTRKFSGFLHRRLPFVIEQWLAFDTSRFFAPVNVSGEGISNWPDRRNFTSMS